MLSGNNQPYDRQISGSTQFKYIIKETFSRVYKY